MKYDKEYKQISGFLVEYKKQFNSPEEFLHSFRIYEVTSDLVKMFYKSPEHPKAILFMSDNLNKAIKLSFENDCDLMGLNDKVLADLLKKDDFNSLCKEIALLIFNDWLNTIKQR